MAEAYKKALRGGDKVAIMYRRFLRPRTGLNLTVEDVPAKRFVLGDWDSEHGWDVLVERSDERHAEPVLRQFPLNAPP